MESKLLLPRSFKRLGLILFTFSLALGILVRFREFEFGFLAITPAGSARKIFDDRINLTDELAFTGIIVSLLFIAFAREKIEDEFINRTRLESWQWAILINFILLLIATWLVHGFAYIDVMMYNMLTIPIIFILRFHFVLYKSRGTTETEAL